MPLHSADLLFGEAQSHSPCGYVGGFAAGPAGFAGAALGATGFSGAAEGATGFSGAAAEGATDFGGAAGIW